MARVIWLGLPDEGDPIFSEGVRISSALVSKAAAEGSDISRRIAEESAGAEHSGQARFGPSSPT